MECYKHKSLMKEVKLFDGECKRKDNTSKRLSQGCTRLMYACQQGNTGAIVEELRTKPGKVRHRDRSNKTALHYCSGQRDLVAAASVAVAAPDLLESADEDGFTPLHLAVIQGNLAMVNLLLANKADVNALDNEGHSVVHWATVCGEIEALRAVLSAGANVTTPDINGGSPLHYAAQMCGANYEGKLGQASSKLALEILSILLTHPHSSVDVTDKDGRQPLLWAASAGSAKAIIALVKAGARVESADKDGLTALHCAASRGHTECIDTIIGLCGAPTDLIDSNGCTALHYAVTLGHADATSRLLDLDADPNRQDRKGRTPSHCGCAKGQFETLKLLKERGANLWLRNAKGDLPIHEAACSGRRELVEWLLEQKPKQVNTTSNDGRTMLHIAAGNDYTDMCKMLLDYGADINSIYRNSRGIVFTPLDCALQRGFRSTAKFLQSNSGLPASKLRLSARRPNAFNDQELVKPLGTSKHIEKEEVHDLQTSKKYVAYKDKSESDSIDCSCSEHTYKKEHRVSHICRHHRKKFRRRTSSCGEAEIEKYKEDSCSDICRSKSNIEIRRRKSKERYYSSEDEDSCENCCRHRKRLRMRRKSKSRRSKEYVDSDVEIEEKYSRKEYKKRPAEIAQKGEYTEAKIVSRQRPQSAKKRIQIDEKWPRAMDLTDEDEIPKSKTVVTQVEVHKSDDSAPPPPSTTTTTIAAQGEVSEKPEVKDMIQQVSTEVSEVIKTAEEAVKKLEGVTASAKEADKNTTAEEENEAAHTQKEDKIKKVTAAETETFPTIDALTAKEEEEGQKVEITTEMQKDEMKEEKKEEGKKEEEKKEEDKKEEIGEQEEQIATKKIEDKPEEKVEMESELSKADALGEAKAFETLSDLPDAAGPEGGQKQLEGAALEQQDTATDGIPLEKTDVKAEREQESRRSFTLLSDSQPQIQEEQDLKTGRKSSFTVLKSDESIDVEEALEKLQEEQPSSFHVVDDKIKSHSDAEYTVSSDDDIETTMVTVRYSRRSAQGSSGQDYNGRRRRLKRRSKTAEKPKTWKSDGVHQTSKDQDSGFEPSPRAMKTKIPSPRGVHTSYMPRKPIYATLDGRSCSSRVEGRRPGDRGACNMTAVTKSIQRNIRRYYMERKIFQHLLELKSLQIRSSKLNESVLVKRAVDDYHKSCIALGAETGGTLRRYPYSEYTFKNFEMFLYDTLKSIQKPGTNNFQNINEVYEEAERRLSPDYSVYENALQCTTKTHRCLHAAHAYTGIPCAAYIPMMNHHTIPKLGFGPYKKLGVGSFYLPKILTSHSKCGSKVSLELSHGKNKQLISLPSDKLDSNKRYYVTFTVKGSGGTAEADGRTTQSATADDNNVEDNNCERK